MKRRLLVGSFCLIVMLVIAGVSYTIGYQNNHGTFGASQTNAQKTVQAICDDITYNDYNSLYNFIIPSSRMKVSQADYVTKMTANSPGYDCQVDSVAQNGNTAKARLTFSDVYHRTIYLQLINKRWYWNIDLATELGLSVTPSTFDVPTISSANAVSQNALKKATGSWHTVFTSTGRSNATTQTFNSRQKLIMLSITPLRIQHIIRLHHIVLIAQKTWSLQTVRVG